jgi:hypothetical protein
MPSWAIEMGSGAQHQIDAMIGINANRHEKSSTVNFPALKAGKNNKLGRR